MWRRFPRSLVHFIASRSDISSNVITQTSAASFAVVTAAAGITTITYASSASSTDETVISPSSSAIPPSPPVASNEATAQWRVFTDMGRDLATQKRYDDAEKYLVKALEAARKGFGDGDPHIASACNNLAELYRLSHKYDKAAPLYEEAIHVLADNYGSKDIRVAFALHNLGGFYFAQKDLEKASKYYQQALDVKMSTVGPGHSETINTLFHLSEVRWSQGKTTDALKLGQQALDAMELMTGSDAAAARRRARYAEMLMSANRHADAENQLRKNLEHVEKVQGPTGGGVASAAENLAMALKASGKLNESRALLQRAYDIRTQSGHAKLQRALTLRRLAEVDLELATTTPGRPAEVAGVQLEAIKVAQGAATLADEAYSEACSSAGNNSTSTPSAVDSVLDWFKSDGNNASRIKHLKAIQQRSVKPELAALELVECLHTLAKVQIAVGEERQAIESLGKARLLAEDQLHKIKENLKQVDEQESPILLAQKNILCSILALQLSVYSQVGVADKDGDITIHMKAHKCS